MMVLNLQKLIGETTAYDKKEAVELSRPKSWLKSVSAFANGSGGMLLFGLKEDNTLVGISNVKEVTEKISELIKDRMDPIPVFDLSIRQVAGKDIVILNVEKGLQCPYFYVGDGGHYAFIRVGNESVPADAQTLKRLSISGQGTTFDAIFSNERFSDYHFPTFQQMYERENDSHLNDKDFVSFGLLNSSGELSNAALLLADNSPFRQSRIFCTRWNGLSKADGSVDSLDDGEYSGSVLAQFSEAMAFFKRNTHVGWKKLPDKRVSLPDYPERAVVEILVNAIVHRDYMQSGSEVHLDIYDDRIEVISPGGMYDGSKIQECDIKNIPSIRRNPLLADIFSRLNLMERKGSGFEKVFAAYQKQINFNISAAPRFSSDANWFRVVLPNLNYAATGKNLGESRESGRESGRESSRERILQFMIQNPTITTRELAEKIGITPKGIEKQISYLKKNNRVKRVGGRSNGQWIVSGDSETEI